ncbi:MAG TPA: T9SS type A sorting domain-containing protein [Chitinophagaceae bacterium]
MKYYISILLLFALYGQANAQITIEAGASWVNTSNVSTVLQDMNFVNNGTFTPGNSAVKFIGNSGSSIAGSSVTSFYTLEVGKTGTNTISLLSNINVNNKVSFLSGLLNLNQKNITLASAAFLENETEVSRITGINGGEVMITLNMSNPNSVNGGNLGAMITSGVNMGTVTIKRGHSASAGTGLTGSINRYYTITPQNNAGLNATFRFRYFDAELNSQTEAGLVMYQSMNSGASWSNLSQNSRSTSANYVEKTGVASFGLQTLGNNNIVITNGVTGLVFTGQRKKATEVQLNWSTLTETNMNGFEVQRKLKTEADFAVRGFVNSKAPGGNSTAKLSYSYLDQNSYADTSYYRLKIVDNTGNFTYSETIAVFTKPKGKGGSGNREMITEASSNTETEMPAKITVGPNPNNGNFWFVVSGIEKETTATLYSMDGRIVRNFKVLNQQQYKVNSISNGIYLLKVPGIDAFRIMVQGSNTSSTTLSTQAATKY